MKESTLSICERNFILRAASGLKRLDGRKLDEFRKLSVHFGRDHGLCYVTLGETRVLAQASCEIQQPKTTRPNEGLLFINVELSPMAAPHFEANRGSDLSVHINRLLEKCIKDSRAVDLESLCIVSEEKAWALRVDLNVLNHEGSIVDCASVAALAALAHFKRPDVTTDGQEIKIHDSSERDPIPITLHHYPVCISYAILNDGENILADPTVMEERVSDAGLVFGINAYREICALHLSGSALAKPKLILKQSSKAAERAISVVQIIKNALQEDNEARQSGKAVGFAECFRWESAFSMSEDRLKIHLSKYTINNDMKILGENDTSLMEQDAIIVNLEDNCAELIPPQKRRENYDDEEFSKRDRSDEMFPPAKKVMKKAKSKSGNEWLPQSTDNYGEGGPSKWNADWKKGGNSDSSFSEHEEIVVLPPVEKKIENIELSDDSEEEDVTILQSEDMENPESSRKSKQKTHSARLSDPSSANNKNFNRTSQKRKNQSRKKKFRKREIR